MTDELSINLSYLKYIFIIAQSHRIPLIPLQFLLPRSYRFLIDFVFEIWVGLSVHVIGKIKHILIVRTLWNKNICLFSRNRIR
ncbi:hypothetical protein HZS_868 [Henneguya salminicola]|nr:hypothetical protein HZS_868 [Henneguya salminicola]